MCGISCVVTLRGHQPLCKDRTALGKTVEESLDTIKHRGPDSNGQWINDNGRIGTYRLCSLEWLVPGT
jgi:asparagine synthase (glutamine-hydrolysing)